MHIYNSIIVLRETSKVFPMAAVMEYSGLYLSTSMDNFLKKEQRGDLKVLGRAYHATLQKREKEWRQPNKAAAQASGASAPRDTTPASSSTRPPGDRRESSTATTSGRTATNGPTHAERHSPLPKS